LISTSKYRLQSYPYIILSTSKYNIQNVTTDQNASVYVVISLRKAVGADCKISNANWRLAMQRKKLVLSYFVLHIAVAADCIL
jgi:hypothetical protein